MDRVAVKLSSESLAWLTMLDRHLEVLCERIATGKRAVRQPDPTRLALLVILAEFWLAQGWRPTQSSGGSYVMVTKALLSEIDMASPEEFKPQLLKNSILEGRRRHAERSALDREALLELLK